MKSSGMSVIAGPWINRTRKNLMALVGKFLEENDFVFNLGKIQQREISNTGKKKGVCTVDRKKKERVTKFSGIL